MKHESRAHVLVVLPTLGKRNDLLRLTMQSLVDQAPCDFDLVMVFPLKNKETKKIAEVMGATMVDDPGSMSAAVNAGVAQAKPWHKYISWIGDDDLLTPNSLATTSKALDDDPDAVVAFGYCDYINSAGKHILTSKAGKLAPWIMTWGPNLVPMPGLLLRRSALNKAGIFDEENLWSMDLDMLLRLRKMGRFVNTRKTLARFRWHESSQTVANRPRVVRETEIVKRKYLPPALKPFAPLWEYPVRWATIYAAKRVNALAKKAN